MLFLEKEHQSSGANRPMSAFENIVYEKDNGIAYITLNRPKALNAVNIRMRDELYEVLPAVKDDPEVMVAIIKGAGERAFSAGADISEFGTTPSQTIARQVRWERDLWGMFLSVQKPLIAAIHGFALGAGIEMAMCCDMRIISEDAQLGLPEANLGMIPTAGGSQTMPRLVHLGQVSEIIFTADRIDAQEALRIGLVNQVVPRDNLIPTAEAV
ncbi:MAG: enoyl-CoA hydratase/isomerase family protein, partial [Chloroflexota bacterium]|nr:enoyl-CoA hydratase/isomerase family protein [Chloroflexota bacterium]